MATRGAPVTIDPTAVPGRVRATVQVASVRQAWPHVGGNLDETARLSRGTVYISSATDKLLVMSRPAFVLRTVLAIVGMALVIAGGGRLLGILISQWIGL